MKIQVIFTIISIFFLSFVLSESNPSSIEQWCNQTPYPQPCQYFMNHNLNSFAMKQESGFKKMTMQVALDQVLQTRSHIMRLGPKSQNIREKVAWADCIHLYGNTVFRLNQTINNIHGQYTEVDTQTWLSTALTNLETCLTGFAELGIANKILPLMSNVSKLVSNALATNKYTSTQPNYKDKFPTRLSSEDQHLLEDFNPASKAHLVVAQDGSGNFVKVQEAVDVASKREGTRRLVIYVKAGSYDENVRIGREAKNMMMVGDGSGKTIVTGSKSVGGGSTTSNSATVAVEGDGFIARDMTFRNTAGPSNGQAVALRSGSDLSVFYRCSFEGYQDTLYVHSNRQFYRECDIYGTVDFIFGNAAAVFQNCNIYSRSIHTPNTVTAHGRFDPNQNTGIVIQNSKIIAFPGKTSSQNASAAKTYLGRPWKKYSRAVFIETFLDSLIDPAGWLEWGDESALNTLYYGEYKNTGPGSSTTQRVKWGGYHVITNSSEASKYTVTNFVSGDSWLPSSGVPFTLGL